VDDIVSGYNQLLPPLKLAGFIPLATTTMLYFYKKTQKALIFTSEVLVKEVEIKGKKVQISAQGSDVKFAMVAMGDQEWPEFISGEAIPTIICSDERVKLEDGTLADKLYWATFK
jgi:hypothetical protein